MEEEAPGVLTIDLLAIYDALDEIRSDVFAEATDSGMPRFARAAACSCSTNTIKGALARDLANLFGLREDEAEACIKAGALYYILTAAIRNGGELALAPETEVNQ